jgi:DNA-binding NarL/FixJ family response regulator
MRVLIVEDEVLVALTLEGMVSDLGHDVSALAHSAEDAVLEAAVNKPDAVLMDVNLGAESGIDAARQIKDRYGIRSIFITGRSDDETRAAAGALDPVAFLSKPVSRYVLEQALNRVRPSPAM